MRRILLILLSYLILSQYACLPEPKAPATLAYEAENSEEYVGWRPREYYTGIVLEQAVEEANTENFIRFEVFIREPGQFYPWILAAQQPYDTTTKSWFDISFFAAGGAGDSTNQMQLELVPGQALQWMYQVKDGSPKSYLDAPYKGMYFLTLRGSEIAGKRILLDRLILTTDRRYEPAGYNYLPDTAEIMLPPAWAFGVIYGGYTNQEETISRIQTILDNDLPIDGYWIDSWFWNYYNQGKGPDGYINFTGDTLSYPDPGTMWAFMDEQQIKSGIWIWDCIQQTGNEAVFQEFLDKDYYDDAVFDNTDAWHNAPQNTPTGNIDFSNEEAVQLWKDKLEPLFAGGLDFLKIDRSSQIPFLKAAFETTQELGKETAGRGFVLSHLHTTYDPAMNLYPTRWTGDAQTAWTQPDYPNLDIYAMGGLKEQVDMVANPRKSTYEIPFLTHDLGGYSSFGANERSDTLYMRWAQFALFNPITTVFSAPGNPTANLPFNFSEQALQNFRKYAQLKLRLFPYIYTYAHRTRETGEKMIQGSAQHPYQYLFGDALLIAPIVEWNSNNRSIYLPPGTWYDFHNSTSYPGDQLINYTAELDQLPIFARSGSIIPMRNYAKNIASGSNDELTLQIYPAETPVEFTLIEDDGTSNEYLEGKVAKTTFKAKSTTEKTLVTINATQGEFQGMNAERTYSFNIFCIEKPSTVKWDGSQLQESTNWSYDPATKFVSVATDKTEKTKRHKLEISY